ncbi:RNA methyltransferase [Oceaniglobus indicus]|uniref:RNA methyltransferase n=1 Tax=Oceaniglobus indicus TaxID=2047749 RepID=UPI000C1848F0|nr:RNA methyltransferase [Oceaniglobus indicus]
MQITPPAEPAFVLVNPQMGENIGAAARAMFNFGLTRMRLVAPRDGWPNPRANALASGAGRILDAATLHATTAEALADCTFTFATTARRRDLATPVFTPEAAMRHAAELMSNGGRVAVLFGPERAGLENADIVRANALISVPVNPEFPSLNLAQCVLLTAYEWRRLSDATPPVARGATREAPATAVEIEKLADHYEARLDEAGFFFPAHKAGSMKLTLRNLWSQLSLSQADVRIFHGVLRQLVRHRDQLK